MNSDPTAPRDSPPAGDPSLRLVVITHCFPAHGGGVERVAARLNAGFAARGIHVDWFSSASDPAPERNPHLHTIPVATWNLIESLTQIPYPLWTPRVLPHLWKAIGSADVVHVHEHFYVGSLMAIAIARIRGRPIVITQHAGAQGLGNRLLTAIYESGTRLLGRLTLSAATRAVFISANVRKFFQRQDDERARLIFNGIDIERFLPATGGDPTALRIRLALEPARPVVLFVGRFVRKKGLRVIETLAGRFPDVQWLLVGSGPEDPVHWQRDNVRVVGVLSHEELPAFYQASDLFLLPSFGEGFPLVVQEALASGLGVLSTDEVATACPAAESLIRCIPTPAENIAADEWEIALRAILSDHAYLQDRSTRSEQARRLWSWERCTAQYLGLFNEVQHAEP